MEREDGWVIDGTFASYKCVNLYMHLVIEVRVLSGTVNIEIETTGGDHEFCQEDIDIPIDVMEAIITAYRKAEQS